MRKIQFETTTHQERSKKIFSLLFIAPQLNSSSSIIRIPLVKFEIDGTFYIPHWTEKMSAAAQPKALAWLTVENFVVLALVDLDVLTGDLVNLQLVLEPCAGKY
jgi:hypothetical protein